MTDALKPVYLSGLGHWSAAGDSPAAAAFALRQGRSQRSKKTVHDKNYPWFGLAGLPALPASAAGQAVWRARALTALRAVVMQACPEIGGNGQSLDPAKLRSVAGYLASSSFALGGIEADFAQTGAQQAATPLPPLAEFADWLKTALALPQAPQCIANACISSFSALNLAHTRLANGLDECALVLGCELENTLTLAGFHSLGLVAGEGENAAGIVLGEAVAALRLDSAPVAHACWRLLACRQGLDGYSPTGMRPDGAPLAALLAECLSAAGRDAEAIDAVLLSRATSGDQANAEFNALHSLFPAALPPLLSFKPFLGHTLGASGAVELSVLAALCLETVDVGDLPGHLLVCAGDARHWPAHRPIKQVLMIQTGFGGGLAAVVMQRP